MRRGDAIKSDRGRPPPETGRRVTFPARYAVALITAGLALAATLALAGLSAPFFFPLLLLAAGFSAWYGGVWPGLVTVALLLAAGVALRIPPFTAAAAAREPIFLHLAIYAVSGGAIAWLIETFLLARRRVERAAARTTRLHLVNLDLAPVVGSGEVAEVVLRHAVAALRASAGAIARLDERGELEILRAEGYAPATPAASAPLAEAVRLQRPVFLSSRAERLARYGDPSAAEAVGGGSLAAVPLQLEGRLVGALELVFAYDRRFSREDRSFVLTLATQCAQALERARLYEAEQTARRRAEQAREELAFLAEASQALAASLDYRATLSAVTGLAVPRLADWCAIDVLEPDGRLTRIAMAHADPALAPELREISRRHRGAETPVAEVIRTGRPRLIPELEASPPTPGDEALFGLCRALGIRSLLIVPLVGRGVPLGAITLAGTAPTRRYGPADLVLAEDLARRAAAAVDHARTYAEAEEALAAQRETLALLDTIFAGAPIGLAFVDRDLRIVRVNAAAAEMAGVAVEAQLGRTVREALGALGERIEPLLRRVFETGRPVVNEEVRSERPGTGDAQIMLASYYPVAGPEGEVRWAGAIVVDVTERRRVEEALVQVQRMEAIAKVAGGVAHEVNNMMTVITGFTGFLRQELPPGDARLADLAEIQRAADRAAGITRQLLAYSRQQLLQPRLLDLNTLLREMAGMLERLLGPGIRLEVDLAPDLHAVRADWAQLEQVFVNLALNARDAMAGAGTFRVETRNVVLGEEFVRRHPESHVAPGRYIQVVVSDTGHGMDAETRLHAFDPFFTTKAPGHGTGLGLAMVYGIIKQSGGFVWIYSEPEQGTTFKIYLPRLAEEPDQGEADRRPAESPRGAETILLVEDEEAVRRVASRVLAARGYTVLEAADGEQALDLVRRGQERVDLVVTDVVMPGMSGRELAERLQRVGHGVPVLYISGYTDDEVVRRGLLTPGSPFLQKPFDPIDLARSVREILDAAGNGGDG